MKREKWQSSFSEWFLSILNDAGLLDYRYPVKGCGVWLPYGFKLRTRVLDIMRQLLDESGHEEVLFPLVITEEMIKKEGKHIASFEDQIFWVTRAGRRKLDEEIALRPTSETSIAPMLKLWIRSHADLPMKIYQVVSIFRYETKATRPLIRVREVTTFKEAHTSHAALEEAERQVEAAVEIYNEFFRQLCLPHLVSKRPDWDKFAGALYSIAHDIIMPDGRTLQIGTVHNLGQNFSKAFNITFEEENGSREYVWQTSYGISERVIAAVVALHGDDRGVVLPPAVAPVQLVIIPIPYKGAEEEVKRKCEDVAKMLREAGVKVELDLRDKLTPGAKFYEWETKGVPLRLEVGPKDVQRKGVTLVRRDTSEKVHVEDNVLVQQTLRLFDEIKSSLTQRAEDWLRTHTYKAVTITQLKKLSREKKGIIEAAWCENRECGLALENEMDLKVLGAAVDQGELRRERCIICQNEAKSTVRLGKSY